MVEKTEERSIHVSLMQLAIRSCSRVIISIMLVAALAAHGQMNCWIGGTGGDWHDADAWELGVPVAGQHVAVTQTGASLTLTNHTPHLASFTMTGGTLTFSNWTTRLEADTVQLNGGVLTLPPAFKNNEMSNRVSIVCNDFQLEAEASINVDGRGYFAGQGPGAGVTGERRAGGGYGGRGGRGLFHRRTGDPDDGKTYGTVAGPLFPGSGGDAMGHGRRLGGNGHGGGLVQIEAEGTVLIAGTISANGLPPVLSNAGGGSGGGVLITCSTLIGKETGSISVCGGNEKALTGGAGAGGRIALNFTDASFLPGFSIDAEGGIGGPFAHIPAHYLYPAEPGTVYLSDSSPLPALLQNTVVLTPETFPVRNAILHVPGLNSLAVDSLFVTNRMVGFPAGFELTVNGSLILSAGGVWVDRLSANTITMDAGATLRTPVVETVGAFTLTGASRFLGARLVSSSALTLSNNSMLYLRAAATNGLGTAWGAELTVTDELTINSGATLCLFCHPTDGGAPRVRAHTLTLAADGVIHADGAGFRKAAGPGKGIDNERYAGGGYGGNGGWGKNCTGADGLQYGSSTGPLFPGSGGGGLGYAREQAESHGGGLVHLEVEQTALLLGTITANGWNTRAVPFLPLSNAGGGSGGGILVAAERIVGDAGTRLSACGGAGHTEGGAGAGGRIALWTRLGGRQAPYPLGTHICAQVDRLPTGFDGLLAEVIDVSGSTDGYNPGEDGSFVWVEGPPPATLLQIR